MPAQKNHQRDPLSARAESSDAAQRHQARATCQAPRAEKSGKHKLLSERHLQRRCSEDPYDVRHSRHQHFRHHDKALEGGIICQCSEG